MRTRDAICHLYRIPGMLCIMKHMGSQPDVYNEVNYDMLS